MRNFDSYFPSPSTGKSATPSAIDSYHIYTFGEVQTFPTVELKRPWTQTCWRWPVPPRLLAHFPRAITSTPLRPPYWGLEYTAVWMPYRSSAKVSHKQLPRVRTTTTTKQRYSYPQRDTLLHLLVYTTISFLRTLYSYFHVFPCNVNWLDPVLNMPEMAFKMGCEWEHWRLT